MQSKDLQLFGVLRALVERINDKDEQVRASVCHCLKNIAKDKPDEVLQTLCTFRKSAPKMPIADRARILTLAEGICRSLNVDEVDADTSITALVDLAVQEMTHSNELIADWQLPASQLLVAIGRSFCDKVMEVLMAKVQPGFLPHYFVVHTIGSLAAANSMKIVPYLKPVLTTHLSLLSGIRSDAMKQAYAYSLARFADAISDYVANFEQTDGTLVVSQDTFSAEIDIAFNILAHSWLPEARDAQLKDQVLHALSAMLALLPKGRAETNAPALLSNLLGSRRRRAPLSLAAAKCLDSVISHPEVKTWPPIEQIVAALAELVLDAPDLEQPLTIKSHYESLRCFHSIDKRFPDKLPSLLVHQVKNGSEKDKATALVILSHLASAGHSSHLSTLVTVVSTLVDDTSIKVKRAAVKVIVVLAHKDVLQTNEGARAFLFIINNCHLGSTSEEEAELRQTCRDSLVLVSSMTSDSTSVLAPLLLKCFLAPEYMQIAGILARCLALLQSREPLEKSKSADVLAKCIVLIGAPFPEVGVYTLQLLKALAPCFEENFAVVLESGTNRLIDSLQDSGWSKTAWEGLLLRFMKDIVKVITDPVWAASFAEAVINIGHEDLSAENRNSQLSCLVSLAVFRKDAALASTLVQEALAVAKYPKCQKVCSTAVGRCAGMDGEGHLQLTLAQLRVASKDLPSQKMSVASKFMPSFFSGDKSKSIEETDRLRAVVLLSYGEIATRIPGSIALMESTNVLEWMLEQAFSAKDKQVLESAHIALNKIFESGPGLSCRDNALKVVMTQLSTGGNFALKCIASLINLPPPLEAGMQMDLLKEVFSFVIDENPGDASLCSTLLSVSKACLLSSGINPASLDSIVTLLEPSIRSTAIAKRTIAMKVMEAILQMYADNLQPGYESPSSFCMATSLLSYCIPRCTDVDGECRLSGVESVRSILEINSFYLGECQKKVCEQLNNHFTQELLDKIANDNDPDTLYKCSNLLSEALIGHLGNNQINSFLESAMSALIDPEIGGSAGLTVVLTELLREKGQELYHQVPGIIGRFIKVHAQLTSDSVKTGFVVSMGSLAQHHPKAVTSALLTCPLPFPESVLGLWRLIGKMDTVANTVCSNLLCQLASSPLLEEPRDERTPCVARAIPLAIVSTLGVILDCENTVVQEIAKSAFSDMLSALLIALAAYVGACPPINTPRKDTKVKSTSFVPNRDAYALVPGRVALETCQTLLTATGFSTQSKILSSCRVDVGENLETYMTSVQQLIRAIVAARGSVVQQMISVLGQNASSPEESTRIAVATILGELVQWPGCSAVLLDTLVQQLITTLDDENASVRQLCLRGLSHIALAPPHLRERYTCSVMVALLQGLEETPGEGRAAGLAREALSGLARILPYVPPEQLGSMQSSLMLRVTPFLTKEAESVRVAAFRVLTQLIVSTGRHGGDSFLEQMPSVLLNFLIGLSDTNRQIVTDCHLGLQSLKEVLTEDSFSASVAKVSAELDYSCVIKAMVPSLATAHPEWVEALLIGACGFTKSAQPATRSCAVVLVGALSHFSDHEKLNMVCTLMTKLLADPCARVRSAAAQAVSHLFSL